MKAFLLIPAVILVFIVMMMPVSANSDQVHILNDTAAYNYEAPDGTWIYEIDISSIPMGSNQTHYLDFEGSEFILTIVSHQWLLDHQFDISLTYPNGTVQSVHRSSTRISGGQYQTKIQPVFTQSEAGYNAYFTVNLEVGMSPLAAEVGTAGMSGAEWDPASAIPFTSVSGYLGTDADVLIYTISADEFEENIRNYNPWYNASSFLSDILTWGWTGVIAFLNMIPVIGPYAVSFLTFSGTILNEMMFWIGFLIQNFPAIVLTVETFIMFAALATSGKSFSSVMKKWFRYNVSALNGLVWFLNLVREWIVSLITMIANIIASLH